MTVHGVVPPGITSADPGAVRQMFANQQIAMLVTSGWLLPIVRNLNPDLDWTEIIQASSIPVPEGTTPEVTTTAWLSGFGINPNTEHPEAAWEFVKFLTSQEREQRWFDEARVTSARLDVSGLGADGVGYEPLLNDPIARAMVSTMPTAGFVPQIAEWPRIIETVNIAAQEVFTGASSAEQALENAHNSINAILSESSGGTDCPAFRS
ncbi:MAG: extracellular solute-binding protein [Anaerolineae bacterium]|nr:extracellular solute-binding protein [Anaerolineae bacterium]